MTSLRGFVYMLVAGLYISYFSRFGVEYLLYCDGWPPVLVLLQNR